MSKPSESPRGVSPTPPRRPAVPPPLGVAASLVAVQGMVLGLIAVLEFASVTGARRELGISTAGFFAGYAVVLLAAAWGLSRRSTWARGPALLTQLIGLGLAWNTREHALIAVLLLVSSAVALIGLVHPDTVAAFDRAADPTAPDDA